MKPFIGLVGCGRWGVNILRDLTELGCDVVVADPDPAVIGSSAACSPSALVDTVSDLPDVEGIVVASPTGTHADVIASSLPRQVPVFVEKPLMTDLAALELLEEAAGDRVFEMHKWRYHPGVEQLGAIARSGDLGPVESLHTTRLGWIGAHHDIDPIWLLAPHDLSIAIEILGALPAPGRARVEHLAGKPAGMTAMLGDAPWVTMEVSGRSPVQRREIRLCCAHGSAVLPDPYADAVVVQRAAADGAALHEHRLIETESPLRRELRAFLDHVGGGAPPRSTIADSVSVARAIVGLRLLADLTG